MTENTVTAATWRELATDRPASFYEKRYNDDAIMVAGQLGGGGSPKHSIYLGVHARAKAKRGMG